MSPRRWTLDVRPLRTSRDFRIFVITQTVSYFGTFITYVAVPLQVAKLTGSPFAVGLLGLCELAPLLVTALLGGALADYFDRRTLVLAGEAAAMITCGTLLANSLNKHPALWLLYVAAAFGAALDGLQRPAIEGLIQRVVPIDQMAAASALRSLGSQFSALAGPAVGGVIIATYGFSWAYAVELGTLSLSLIGLLLIRATPPPSDADRPSIASIVAGLRYARSRPELIGTYVVDIVAMFFGMPMALFPFVAPKLGGDAVLGLLYAAPSAGALVATLTSGWTGHVRRHGLGVIWSAAIWGVAIVGFGLAGNLWLALFGLAVAGGADMISGVFRQTIWNQTVPDRLRGRLAGVEMLSWSIGPTLGNVESGLAARALGVGGSIISGGVACVIGTVALAAALPAFRRYDGPTGVARREAEEAAFAAAATAPAPA
jgi:MFS family permease